MKTILEFDGSDEDQYKLERMMLGPSVCSFLNSWEIKFREVYKYRELTEEQTKIVEELRTIYFTLKTEELGDSEI